MAEILYLAPLQGLGGRVFRNAVFAHFPGYDAAIAPFIPATLDADAGEKQFRDLLPEAKGDVPLIPQILGNEAESIISSARVLAGLGYREFNWNLGCPYPMVADKRRGSGLLPFPDLIRRILDQVCARSPLPVSVKTRLGRHDSREFRALAPVFNDFPLKSVTIHPRVGVQMYGGSVDLDAFAEAASLLAHDVVYNGDITSRAFFQALRGRFPTVKGWMIGRGAISDPFLGARIKGLALPVDELGTIKKFHDELYREYRALLSGPRHVLDKMKELWTYLGPAFAGNDRALKDVTRAKTMDAYELAAARLMGLCGR